MNLDKLVLEKVIDSRYNYLLNTLALTGVDECHVIKYDNEIVGVIEYEEYSETQVHIHYIYVDKFYREKGIARHIIEQFNKKYTITGDSKLDAVGFWQNVGADFDGEDSEDKLEFYDKYCYCVPFIIH